MTRRRALRGPGAPAGDKGRTETPPAKLSACATCHYPREIRTTTGHAHYPGGAMRTSRPTAITPAWGAPPLHTRNSHTIYTALGAHRLCPVVRPVAVGRDVPIAPPRHRRGARLGIPRTLRACRGSVRGTARGRAAHPARCHNRAAITHAKFERGGSPPRPTAITHAIFARGVLPRHCPWRLATAATASWRAVFWRIPGWNRMRGECRLRNGDCGACIRVGQRKQNRHSTSSNIRREESSEAPFPF